MFRRYKEIGYGLLVGLTMWVVDAAMHAQLGEEIHSSGSFLHELLSPGATQFIFRAVFLIIAVAFGWALWRSNWRERELRALEDAIIGFHRRLDSPAMRIVSHVRMLQGRSGGAARWSELERSVLEAIGDDARTIDQLAQQYIKFSELVMAGRTGDAITALRAIETWAGGQPQGAPPQPQGARPTAAT